MKKPLTTEYRHRIQDALVVIEQIGQFQDQDVFSNMGPCRLVQNREARLTQGAIAPRGGMSRQRWNGLERNNAQCPKVHELVAVANALTVPVESLRKTKSRQSSYASIADVIRRALDLGKDQKWETNPVSIGSSGISALKVLCIEALRLYQVGALDRLEFLLDRTLPVAWYSRGMSVEIGAQLKTLDEGLLVLCRQLLDEQKKLNGSATIYRDLITRQQLRHGRS